MLDAPQPIRANEELNLLQLQHYLDQHLGGHERVEIQQFPSGYSNLTYWVKRGAAEFVLRRPPFGAQVKSGHDMEREFNVLSALRPAYAKVPEPILYCADATIIGAPFYLMERVKGVILRNRILDGLVLPPQTMRRLSEELVDNLVAIHAIEVTRSEVSALGRPEGYAQRQVEGWIRRYRTAQTDEIAQMDRVADWLGTHLPAERYVSFIHNDYKYDNVVFDPDLQEVVAILDWEMATVGDPFMDLGTSLGYWTEANAPAALRMFGLTLLPGNLTRQQVADRYMEKSGRYTQHLVFYYVFGLFKIGVIVQQIYYRYRKGFTQDERFAGLIHVLQACATQADQAIGSGTLHP